MMKKMMLAVVALMTVAFAEVTYENYLLIETKSKFEKVIELMGEGIEIKKGGMGANPGFTSTTYMWGDPAGKVIYVEVFGGRVFLKSQTGLSPAK